MRWIAGLVFSAMLAGCAVAGEAQAKAPQSATQLVLPPVPKVTAAPLKGKAPVFQLPAPDQLPLAAVFVQVGP